MVKKIISQNLPIKLISIILGYSFWYMLSQSHPTKIWLDVPICFYNMQENITVESPEKIKIQLSGKRIDLYTVDKDNLACHLDIKDFSIGEKVVKITERQLFLPDNLQLTQCLPASVKIAIKEKEISA